MKKGKKQSKRQRKRQSKRQRKSRTRVHKNSEKGRGMFPIDCSEGVISCGDEDYIQPGTKVVASRDNVEQPGEMIEPLVGVWGGDTKLYVDEDTEYPEREFKIYDGFSSKLEPPFREVVDARCFVDHDSDGDLIYSDEPKERSGSDLAGKRKKRRHSKKKHRRRHSRKKRRHSKKKRHHSRKK